MILDEQETSPQSQPVLVEDQLTGGVYDPVRFCNLMDSFIEGYQNLSDERPKFTIDNAKEIVTVFRVFSGLPGLTSALKENEEFKNALIEAFIMFIDPDLNIEVIRILNYISSIDDDDLTRMYFNERLFDHMIDRINNPDEMMNRSRSLMQLKQMFTNDSQRLIIRRGILGILYNTVISEIYSMEKVEEIYEYIINLLKYANMRVLPYVALVLQGILGFVIKFDEANSTSHAMFITNIGTSAYNLLSSSYVGVQAVTFAILRQFIAAMNITHIDGYCSAIIEKLPQIIEDLPSPDVTYITENWSDFFQNLTDLMFLLYNLDDGITFMNNRIPWSMLWEKVFGWDSKSNQIIVMFMCNMLTIDPSQMHYFGTFEKLASTMQLDSSILADSVQARIAILETVAKCYVYLFPYQISLLLDQNFLDVADPVATLNPKAAYCYASLFNLMYDSVRNNPDLSFKYREQFEDQTTLIDIADIADENDEYKPAAQVIDIIQQKLQKEQESVM